MVFVVFSNLNSSMILCEKWPLTDCPRVSQKSHLVPIVCHNRGCFAFRVKQSSCVPHNTPHAASKAMHTGLLIQKEFSMKKCSYMPGEWLLSISTCLMYWDHTHSSHPVGNCERMSEAMFVFKWWQGIPIHEFFILGKIDRIIQQGTFNSFPCKGTCITPSYSKAVSVSASSATLVMLWLQL